MPVKIYDDDYEIIFTSTVNIYEDKLIFDEIGNFKFVFLFEEKKEQKGTAMEIDGSKAKTATIKLFNFKNVLGSGTTKKIKIIETDDGKSIYFSLYAKSLNENTTFLQVTTTFYIK